VEVDLDLLRREPGSVTSGDEVLGKNCISEKVVSSALLATPFLNRP
jgi:hypothetical protein